MLPNQRDPRAEPEVSFNEWEEKDVIGDLTGQFLPPDSVKVSKMEELKEIGRRGLWFNRPIEEWQEKI